MNWISVQTPKYAISWRLLEFKLQSGISVCHGSHLQCLVFWFCWRKCMIADGYSGSGSYPCDGCNQHGLISGPFMVPCQYWIFICVFTGGFALFVGVMLWFTVSTNSLSWKMWSQLLLHLEVGLYSEFFWCFLCTLFCRPDDTPWDGGMAVVAILFLVFLEAFDVWMYGCPVES
jgi:hypothetical protein